jgi:hypothetical protein
MGEPAILRPNQKPVDARAVNSAGSDHPFVANFNSELTDKGFLVAARTI